MKKTNANEVHTFQIDLKQYVNEIKWDSHFKEYFHGNQTKIKYGSIEFTGTKSELDAFLDKMPDNDSQFKLIGVTNLSDVLIDVNNTVDGNISVRVFELELRDNQIKMTTKDVLSQMFMDPDDMPRMEANLSRRTFFRTWIRRSDFESITNLNYQTNENV
jgi:hypothetical protein